MRRTLEVLLVADTPVGGQQKVEACLFSGVQQLAIAQRVPTSGLGRMHRVLGQGSGEALRRAVVKQDEHL